MNIVVWCNRIIRYGFYALFFLVPLILSPWNYELFEFNKMIITYTLTIVVIGSWFLKMSIQKRIYFRKSPLDIPILLFLGSQFISSLFSIDPHVSWFGYYSRFNGGMLSLLAYALLYWAFLSNIGHKDEVHNPALTKKTIGTLFIVLFSSALLVSLYAILQRLGIDKDIWVQDVQSRVFSTLGQPNWLAAFAVSLLPISLSLGLIAQQHDKRQFAANGRYLVWISISITLFITLLFTKSRSGIAGFGVASAMLFLFMLWKNTDKKKALVSLFIPYLIFFLITAYVKTGIGSYDRYFTFEGISQYFAAEVTVPSKQIEQPTVQTSTLLESGGTESGKIRQLVWQGAITAWRSSTKAFFIGTGTETFAFAFFQYKPIAHNLTSEWDFLYNKAHNEYLNYLTTTGSFGLATYLFLLAMVTLWTILTMMKRKITTETKLSVQETFAYNDSTTMSIGIFAGWISILVTNFFGFSVVIMQLFLFLFPAIIFAILQKDTKSISIQYDHIPTKIARGIGFVGLLVTTLSLLYISVYWIADTMYANGYRQSRQGQLANAYRSLSQAILLRPSEPNYYDELGVVLSGLSVASMEAGSATSASNLAQQSLTASDNALKISPNNVNYWKSRTKIYFGFSSVDTTFTEAAIQSLEKALLLSPLDPKITYNLAVLYGRLGQNEKAIELLKQTLVLKPNYRDAYYALYVFYLEVKQPNVATAILQEYLSKVDPNDKEFQDRIKQGTPETVTE